MRKIIAALALAALSVQANAALTTAPLGKFFCRADTLMRCDNDGNCTKDSSKISAMVDFVNGTITSLNIENSRPKPLLRVEAQDDVVVFSNYIGNVFTITKKETSLGPSFGFKAIIFLGTPVVHFGSCNRV